MTDIALARNLIHDAFPLSKWGTAQAACWQAYRQLKLKSERRARALWNGEALRVDAYELDSLRAAALSQARQEYADTRNRILALEAALRLQDEDFHSDQIAALEREAGDDNSAMD